MSLKRGDIVLVAVKGPYTSKPRPVAIVQASETLDLMESITVCPITSMETGADFVRIAIAPGRRSGLERDSWIMADKIVTVPRSALKSEPVGRQDAREMAGLKSALRTWLDL